MRGRCCGPAPRCLQLSGEDRSFSPTCQTQIKSIRIEAWAGQTVGWSEARAVYRRELGSSRLCHEVWREAPGGLEWVGRVDSR